MEVALTCYEDKGGEADCDSETARTHVWAAAGAMMWTLMGAVWRHDCGYVGMYVSALRRLAEFPVADIQTLDLGMPNCHPSTR